MNTQLKAKLTKRLANAFSGRRPFDRETLQAALVDIRNLLEVLGEDTRYQTLNFHCDWILHPDLTRNKRAHKIIKALDVECVRSLELKGLSEWPEQIGNDLIRDFSEDFISSLSSRFTFHAFESELRDFLDRHGIAKLLPIGSAGYHGFELIYCQLIEDRPWDCTNAKDRTKYVNRVQLQLAKQHADGRAPRPGRVFPFFLWWRFFWNDEPRIILEVEFLAQHER